MSFNPYQMNGGSIVGISGNDFSIVASDTRLCQQDSYLIHSRNNPHVHKMSEKLYLGAVGFNGDVLTLVKMLKNHVRTYNYKFQKDMSANAFAAMLSVTLYGRRFFPLYVQNILAGVDENGKGVVYSYDPVGSYEKYQYRAAGSSGAILQPFLDNRIGGKNLKNGVLDLTAEEGLQIVKDVFISAAERDIHCGDNVVIKVIKKEGVKEFIFPLRRD